MEQVQKERGDGRANYYAAGKGGRASRRATVPGDSQKCHFMQQREQKLNREAGLEPLIASVAQVKGRRPAEDGNGSTGREALRTALARHPAAEQEHLGVACQLAHSTACAPLAKAPNLGLQATMACAQ